MPIFTTLRKLLSYAPVRQEEEEAEAPARRPLPEPAQDRPAQAERPYRDLVENEARKYWQDMVQSGGLAKPDREEVRAGALRVLGLAQRYRPGPKLNPALNRAHMAVNVLQLHLVDIGRLKHPFTPSEASPNFVEALMQLADDAAWTDREMPLPAHPDPQHPPIYFSLGTLTGRPIPRKDAVIRGDYVHEAGSRERLSREQDIYPWQEADEPKSAHELISRRWDACYTVITDCDGSRDKPWSAFPDRSLIIFFIVERRRYSEPRLGQFEDYHPILSYRPNRRIPKQVHFSPYRPTGGFGNKDNFYVIPSRPGPNHNPARNSADADDAGWTDKEIRLPAHPEPKHPPIYFTRDPATGRPVPREDAVIRGDYVYYPMTGYRLTRDDYIYPWRGADEPKSLTELTSRGLSACYTFVTDCDGSRDKPWSALPERSLIKYFFVIRSLEGRPTLVRKWDYHPLLSVLPSVITSCQTIFSPYKPTVADRAIRLHKPAPMRRTGPDREPNPARNSVGTGDAGLAEREIPLPDHPEPRHPPIYYTADPASGRLVPREDALIRGDYVHDLLRGARFTRDEYIHPWTDRETLPGKTTDLTSRGWRACYTLHRDGDTVEILLYRTTVLPHNLTAIAPLFTLHFSPHPP